MDIGSSKKMLKKFLYQFLIKIKIYKTIILPAVLYGCGTWSLILREENRVRVFENRALKRIFVPKMKWWESGEDYIMTSFITFTLHQVIVG